MKRPDVDAVLAPLKGFQRKTVDHGFHRLFEARDSTHRFLVADEVGLGKTLVARGIIARTIDHLWDSVDRIDIIYICSNASIARQNLRKLKISGAGDRSVALATRLTMLATELAAEHGHASMADSKLNFISFTPRTSFDMGHSTGQWPEREVLFHMVQPHIDRWTPLANLLQGNIGDARWWRRLLKEKRIPIEKGIRDRFDARFSVDTDLQSDIREVLDTWFHRHRKSWPEEARRRRNEVIGHLRSLLASVCVDGLEPDLVILDEFQRFKGMLETRPEERTPAAELAQALFEAETPEGNPVRTLLLSATPYKLYTADAEIEHEDHYEDFLATTRFLLAGDDARVERLKHKLMVFGGALKRAAAGGADDVASARRGIELILRRVMARTERVSASEAQDAMVDEPTVVVTILPSDVRQYMAADALFREVGDRDPMQFWKSAPYLAHFMRGYRFDQRLEEAVETSPHRVAGVLQTYTDAFLDADAIQSFEGIDPAHAKLRELLGDVLDGGLWRLLWMPPTVPYWPLGGPFVGQEGRTKSLLFSAWNVVPDVVSAVVSYEVERRMAGGGIVEYADPAKQQRRLLRLAQTAEGKRSGHRLLLVLLPCLTLADECHPLRAPQGNDPRSWVRERTDLLLSELPNPSKGEVDNRWEWLLPLLLDPGLRDFLRQWQAAASWNRPNPEYFNEYVDDLLAIDPADLGVRPPRLSELATELALGAPGVIASRMLAMAGIDDTTRRRLSVDVAMAFWSQFNRPTVITMLRELEGEDVPYWRAVIRYCRDGNLQAVVDETWHLTWEQHAWSSDLSPTELAEQSTKKLSDAIQPKASRVHARFLRPREDGGIERDEVRIRTDLALRFGDVRGDDQRLISQDGVRSAFNSPFRPFILTSTSVGQEGLDFHPWCHRLVHWNLPGNPVDLEQREGRVHRYKGHAVRRNVASAHAQDALGAWSPGLDLWKLIFDEADAAARGRGDSDLVPYWLAPGSCRVQRHVPLLPWTREVEAFTRLKKQLAAYRVVFGQPRQEELLSLLERAEIDADVLREWVIDLRP